VVYRAGSRFFAASSTSVVRCTKKIAELPRTKSAPLRSFAARETAFGKSSGIRASITWIRSFRSRAAVRISLSSVTSCLFPEKDHVPTACATGEVTVHGHEKPVDAALPFLSFPAGAMAAGEILKLGLAGYPFSPNRVVLHMQLSIRVVKASLTLRQECICQRRSAAVHRKMNEGTRFAGLLSTEGPVERRARGGTS
jgi:hypothetical protein